MLRLRCLLLSRLPLPPPPPPPPPCGEFTRMPGDSRSVSCNSPRRLTARRRLAAPPPCRPSRRQAQCQPSSHPSQSGETLAPRPHCSPSPLARDRQLLSLVPARWPRCPGGCCSDSQTPAGCCSIRRQTPGCPPRSPRSGRPGGRGASGLSASPACWDAGWGGRKRLAQPGPEVQTGAPTRVFVGLSFPDPVTHLPIEGHALLGLDEVPVGEVGPLDHRGNSLLVLG